MYCRNCGKQITEDANFCMYCGTPVEVIPADTMAEVQTPPEMDTPASEPVIEEPKQAPEERFFAETPSAEPEPEVIPEEPAPKRERPVFEEINWNVSEYPDSETVVKTDDIDFNWNARPEDIPEPVARRNFETEAAPSPERESVSEGFVIPERKPEPPVEPADIDIKLDQAIRGEGAGNSLFGDATDSSEELSAAERIDKFYTFNRKNEEFQQLLNREYEKVRAGGPIADEMSRADAIADELFEARDQEKPQTMEDLFEAEGIVKPYQPKAFESDVLQRIEAQEAEKEAKRLEEEARKAEIEKARKEAEEARLKAEKEAEEARLKAEEEARLAAEAAREKAEAEAREAEKAAEEARIKAEEEAKARAEEAARREEAEMKARAEEEARRIAEEEARIKAEAVAKYQAQEEARIRAEEELKAAQEAAKIRAQQEARIAAEEQAKYEAAKEARRLEEEEAKRRLEAEQDRLAREANESIAAEEARKVLEQTARMRDEEAAKIRAAVAGLRASTRVQEPVVRREVAEAHKATQDQINEMAKARSTFFGEIDIAKELEAEAQPVQESKPEPDFKPEPEVEKLFSKQEEPADSPVTGRNTMLRNNLSDTKVFDKEEILAGIPDATIAVSKDAFADMNEAKPIDFKDAKGGDESIDDLLSQLESLDAGKTSGAVESDFTLMNIRKPKEAAPSSIDDLLADVTGEADAPEVPAPVVEDVEEDAAETMAEDFTAPMDAAPEMPAETEETISDFADLSGIGEAKEPFAEDVPADEPTMIFRSEEPVQAPAEDLSGTRRFDIDLPVETGDADATIVVGQAPQTFAELPANDFDDYGNAEAAEFVRAQAAEAAEADSIPQGVPSEMNTEDVTGAAAAAVAAVPAAAALSRKDQKAAAKEAKRAAKEAKKAAKAAPAVTEDTDEDAEEAKGGKGRTVLIILLILLCLVLAAEIIGIGVHYVAPQSRVAELVDNQLNKVIHMITGDDENDYQMLSDRREGPPEDMAAIVADQADRNYNGLIQSIEYDANLQYTDEQAASNSDLVLSAPITEFEWGRDENNNSVYYDEAVIGQAIAYESQKYALLKDGDESVLSMIAKKSTKKSLLEKKNSNPGEFTKLEIGEVRVSGTYYYVWIRETIGGESKERVIKMHPESQFVMMIDKGYDI